MAQFLIVTADDFGRSEHVNEAVELACRKGILTAASLMVCAPAAADALRRARTLPRLRVGLHLVLADGEAALAPELIPALARHHGSMDASMVGKSFRFFASRHAQRQLEAEVCAQFAAFKATGLPLDHVNVHKHFHLHPTILEVVLRVGRQFGVTAVRVPDEPVGFAMRGGWVEGMKNMALAPWVARMKRRIRSADLLCNDQIFGIASTGRMDEANLLAALSRLRSGIAEIYLHPAMQSGRMISSSMSQHRHADELAALLSPRVQAAVQALQIQCGGYADAMRRAQFHPA